MLDHHRITISDVIIGEPLPWDVYDGSRRLLLRKGHVVDTVHQIEELAERGLFIDAGHAASLHAKSEARTERKETPSALRFINLAHKRLERLLYNLNNEADAAGKIVEVAKAVAHAVDINADIALACVLLNQASGKYAVRHCIDTAVVTLLIARAMRKSGEESVIPMAAALTMNIGMLRQQDGLQERTEPLSEREIDAIRRHPDESAAILAACGITDPAWLMHVRMHHENPDGSGYPCGAGAGMADTIRILGFADRYCAAVSHRGYRKPLLPHAALRDIFIVDGKPSDPLLAALFIREIGTLPPGTFVRLQNGEIGVVTRKGKTAATPVVHALVGPRGAPLSFPIERHTDKNLYAVREPVGGEQATLRFSLQHLWGEEAAL